MNEKGAGRPLGKPSKRVLLHEELARILLETGNRWTTPRELAIAVNKRGKYRKRDGKAATAFQIHAQYGRMFERQGLWVRLPVVKRKLFVPRPFRGSRRTWSIHSYEDLRVAYPCDTFTIRLRGAEGLPHRVRTSLRRVLSARYFVTVDDCHATKADEGKAAFTRAMRELARCGRRLECRIPEYEHMYVRLEFGSEHEPITRVYLGGLDFLAVPIKLGRLE